MIDIQGFNIAINEAKLLNIEFDIYKKETLISLFVLTMPEEKFPPEDATIFISLQPTSRIVVTLKDGQWNDSKAKVLKLDHTNLSEAVQEFHGLPIYGWDFLRLNTNKVFSNVSLELKSEEKSVYEFSLFQASPTRYLEVYLCFNEIKIMNSNFGIIAIEEFIAGGRRWWEGLNNKDPRTDGFGIYPLGENKSELDAS